MFPLVFPLNEKSKFYNLASIMSEVLKNLVIVLNDDVYVGNILCENEKLYAQWSDLKKFELFRFISKTFKKNKLYSLSVSKDTEIIDLIIESNFKYYSYFSFFLPKSNIVIQPTCHSELIIYSEKTECIKSLLKNIITIFNNIKIVIRENTGNG